MKYKTTFVAKSFSTFSLVLFPAISYAVIDQFDPYAFAGAFHETNIFRTDDDEDDDTVGRFGAGFESDLKLSRQHLLVNALVAREEYDSFSKLSNTGYDAGAAWRWQVGNLWSGNLGYNYKQELASFEQFLTRQKDTRTTHRADFKAGYQIHPDWELIGGVGYSDISYDNRKRLERDLSSGTFEVQYRNTLRTRVGVRAGFTDADLNNEQDINGIQIDNDYTEAEISAVFYWEGSGKSSLEASWGYTEIDYDQLDERDYEGSTGRLTHHWLISGKTRLDTSVWRETDSQYDEITTYVISKGVSVNPVWSATPKITVRGEVQYINNDYRGENDIRVALGGQRRDDDTWIFGVGMVYNVHRNVNLSLGYTKQDRDSSEDLADFDNHRFDAEARVRF